MKLPLSWLSDYTDMTGITPKEYDAKLTMSGSKVEEVYYLGAEIENVVTGKILSVVDHPDSDHLKICHLDLGDGEPVQIQRCFLVYEVGEDGGYLIDVALRPA